MTPDFAGALLAWYEQNKRDLPWRQGVTPYRVWVSEIMLQQTRIEAARGYYERFMAAFPTVQDLAAADIDHVLKLWEGLGYYSRARNLHRCAQLVCGQYGGEFPASFEELRSLPGIGDYTAGAIASIAFGLPEPAVDGNVLRVLSRLTRFGDSIAGDRVKKQFRAELRARIPEDRAGDFTSALMELGETVCIPGTPDCAACPLNAMCAAHMTGEETSYPVIPPKKPRRIEHRRVLLILCGEKTALRRRPEKGLLAGLWEYPNDEEPDIPAESEPCGEAKHIFSHVEWHMTGWILHSDAELPGYTWVTREERLSLAMPEAFRYYSRVLDRLGH